MQAPTRPPSSRPELAPASSDPAATPAPCVDCGTADPALRYRSGRMSRCYDCQNYWNLAHKRTGGGVEFEREAFLRWKRADPARRRCHYCGIDPASLYALAIVRAKRRCENIGVDRLDNLLPYRLDNLVACCPICNGVRSDVFSVAEMEALGQVVRAQWQARLAAATA